MSSGASEPADITGAKVFITYRREETAAHAGRLYDAMVARFGEDNVFMDVDMAPGVDFVERIPRRLRLPGADRRHGAEVGDGAG